MPTTGRRWIAHLGILQTEESDTSRRHVLGLGKILVDLVDTARHVLVRLVEQVAPSTHAHEPPGISIKEQNLAHRCFLRLWKSSFAFLLSFQIRFDVG
jgi:hypothetical protein